MVNEMNTTEDMIATAELKLPSLVVERYAKLFTPEDYATTLHSFANPKPITFRVNTNRSTEKEILAEVLHNDMLSTPIAWCPLGHRLDRGSVRQLQELSSGGHGGLYIQSASSMLAVHAMQVEPDMRVLDLCAAPGSKTTQLAAAMKNRGMLVANDRSRKRIYRLREILQQQGATNVEILLGKGERLGQTHADCFDRVLVDVPCSGEGRFQLDKPVRLERWNINEVRTLAKLQEQLLIAAIRCVRVGGKVVYSTCTFAPEENEFVLNKVLRKSTIDAKVIPLPSSLIPSSARQAITRWEGNEVTEDVTSAVRIVPDGTTTGFFVACIERNA